MIISPFLGLIFTVLILSTIFMEPSLSITSIFSDEELVAGLMNRMEVVEVKAGEALLFNQRLVHFSPPNTSEEIRYSIISSLIPSEADALLYYKEQDDSISVFKMKDDFFNNYNNFLEEKDLEPKGIKLY